MKNAYGYEYGIPTEHNLALQFEMQTASQRQCSKVN